MSRFGFSDGSGLIVPLTFMGIPFNAPSVLLRVNFWSANVKFIAGFVIFCPMPENSGLLIEPVTAGFEGVPFTVTEAVIFPASLYCGPSGIMLSIRLTSSPAIFAVIFIFGFTSNDATLPLM